MRYFSTDTNDTNQSPLALVTGASGMLGRATVEVLLAAGVRVRVFVRPSSDIRYLQGRPVEVVHGDAADRPAIQRATAGADLLFHIAGYLSARAPFETDPGPLLAPYQQANVAFTESLLAAARKTGVQRFVYASSASVYALDAPVPTPEDAPLRPESHYGRSKLLAEQAIATASVPFTIVRPSVIYGPDDRYFTPAALRLLRLLLLPLVNGGRTLLDLIYVQDVSEFLWLVVQEEAATGRIYNAGPGVPTSLRDLAAAYRALTGRGPTIMSVPPGVPGRLVRWGGPLVRPVLARLAPGSEAALSAHGVELMTRDMQLDMSRAETELGYRPRFDLQMGLAQVLGLRGA